MSGWIKFWKDMPNDPRVLAAASRLAEKMPIAHLSRSDQISLWRNAVTGAVVTLWCYADEHIRDDDTLPLTSQTIDAVVGLEGFFSIMPREWIVENDDGCIMLPGYCEKNSLIAKRKRTIKNNARVTRWRRAQKASSNGVTQRHATHHNSAGDLDQDNKNISTEVTRKKVSRETISEAWFLDFKLAYPHRAGDQGWRKAHRAAGARISEGHTTDEMLAGAKRYAAHCEATGKTGTEFVKQACTFLGPDKHFLEPWTIPPANGAKHRDDPYANAI